MNVRDVNIDGQPEKSKSREFALNVKVLIGIKPKKKKMISKKTRFEVFKRDGFQCAYCGKTPPEIVLEVDHIEPVSEGGTDDMENLLTACFDCNRGKRNIKLDKIPTKLEENIEVLREKEDQYKEYQKLIKKISNRLNRDCGKIDDIYNGYFSNYRLSDNFKNGTLRNFLKYLPYHEVEESMHLACGKIKSDQNAIKYFCGICWNKIKGIKPWWEDK